MGFGDGLMRFIQGKPIYEPEDVTPKEQQVAAQAGGKVVPVVRIERLDPREQGANLDLYAHVRNDSNVNVTIDKFRMFGKVREVDTTLRAGEVRELHLYSGPRPTGQNDHDAFLQYFDDSHDYFEARHDVFFRPRGDGTYTVHELRVALPIKDIQ